jgi:hypothetical protein
MPVTILSPNVENYFVGKGIISIKMPTDADYVDIGNVPTFELTPAVTKLDHFSARAGIKSKDLSIVLEKTMTLKMVMEEGTPRNLGLALLGAVNDSDPGAVTIALMRTASIICAVKFVGTNQVGVKWTYDLPQVEFTPNAAISLIGDTWGTMEVQGDVLYQAGTDSFGTATGDFTAS